MKKSPSFREFYEFHFDKVYRFVYFRVQMNEAVTEDLVSEIFFKALNKFDTYDPSRSQYAWIMTIARNHLANYYRDRKEVVDVDEIAFVLPGEDGRETMEQAEEQHILYDALATLSPEERRLVEMKYIEGYKYKEIATMVGKSVGAVRVETHRLLKRLKEILPKI